MRSTLSGLLKGFFRSPGHILAAVSAALIAVLSSCGLMMTGAYILAKAAFMVSIADIQTAVVAVRFFGISRSVFRYLERLISHSVNFHIVNRLRDHIFVSLERGYPESVTASHRGDMLFGFIRDSEAVEKIFNSFVLPLTTAWGTAVLGTILIPLWLTVSRIHAALLFFLLLIPLPIVLYMISAGESRAERGVKRKLAWMAGDIAESGTDLHRLDREGHFTGEYLRMTRKGLVYRRRIAVLDAVAEVSVQTLIALAVLAYVFSPAGFADRQLVPVVALGLFALQEVFIPMNGAFVSLASSFHALQNVFDLLAAQSGNQGLSGEENLSLSPISHLKLSQVRLRTPDGQRTLIKSADTEIRRGDKIWIMGRNGSGKSSLMQLLLKFRRPDGGRILVDGQDLMSLDPDDLRRHIAYMPQEMVFFHDSLRNNLSMNHPEIGEDKIRRLLEVLELDRIPLLAPDQLDVPRNLIHSGLSGGELQRLSLIRTLLSPAEIRIFDEPYSHLDAHSADLAAEAILNGSDADVRIVISHIPVREQAFSRIWKIEKQELLELR